MPAHLDQGAFTDQQTLVAGHTALMDAVIYKHADVVRLLLRRAARTTIRSDWQETAPDIARRDGHAAIADAIAAQPLVLAIKPR
ncbi:ankyrin repeat domain-containing protein [Sphingomonas sp. IC-56]|uniref:ankyrin repeat domain-containing protein n=1 Tax=Sphingomonas sp. IC-56 TaxID=2898529 RepID=UPI001E2E6B4C|nr:ankyrin repeat domain-containing protein [Sphingomonas sp. IC-56]MCD2325378.1 ankyrin repeat domain-containing protein [Sphingomonas sp. IC-56]